MGQSTSDKASDAERRDEILRRMLSTPPKRHEDDKANKPKPTKRRPKQD